MKNEEKNSLIRAIIVIAGAIVVAVGVLYAFKTICDKYHITTRKSRKKKFIDFDDADDWAIDEKEEDIVLQDDIDDVECACDTEACDTEACENKKNENEE